MSRELYIERNFRGPALAMIEQANAIIEEYQKSGFRLTLRQLYYQFVARDLIANTKDNYDLLGRTMVVARDAGQSDWNAMEDRTRAVNTHAAWASPTEFLESEIEFYAEDPWTTQSTSRWSWSRRTRCSGSLRGVRPAPGLLPRHQRQRQPDPDAGRRPAHGRPQDHIPVVIYLGDHDPTGIDITRDLEERLTLYARREIEVRRIALTMAQVRRNRLPPNPQRRRTPT